jgi:uncharacterized membrane protein
MANIIRKTSLSVLILSVVLLTFLAILSIWDVLDKDVFWKSVSTISVIGFAALITVLAGNAWDNENQKKQIPPAPRPNPNHRPPHQS